MIFRSVLRSFNGLNSSLVKNISYGFGIRLSGILLQFILVPISLRYVEAGHYGLWLTISTMVMWLGLFDLGLTNGLRNKISERISQNRIDEIGGLLKLSYKFLFILAAAVFLAGLTIILLTNWRNVIDVPATLGRSELLWVFSICLFFFCFNLALKPIFALHYSLHNSYVESFATLAASLISLLLILAGRNLDFLPKMIWLSIAFSMPAFLVLVTITLTTMRKYPQYFQSGLDKAKRSIKEISGISLKYFVIQISATVVFMTNSFLISHFFGNEQVTSYNIVARYFSLPVIFFGIILTPFWNIVAENVHGNNGEKLKMVFQQVRKMLLLMLLMLLGMMLISKIFFQLWVGDAVDVNLNLILAYSFFTLVSLLGSYYTLFINGSGDIKLQTIVSFINSVLYLPIMIAFIKYSKTSLEGMVIFSTIWLGLTLPIKYYQVVRIVRLKTIKDEY